MNATRVIAGAAAGSALMYVLDPNSGRRRRALVRDQLTRARRKTRDGLGATARDLGNRATGMTAAARRRWSAKEVSDTTLVERVRAALGRVCSHPRAIDVDSQNGAVTLRGPILASELKGVIAAAAGVPGVASVNNELDAHDTSEGIPSLQGEGRVGGPSLDILQSRWSPATRAMIGAGLLATGAWVVTTARRRHDGHDVIATGTR